ncbi:MAG: hypothetical protein ACREXJ_02905 [Gammaproteobacteria bacterium]
MSITTLRLLIALLASLGPSSAYAHGGVAIEFDECVARIGKFTMHFTAYQSGSGTEYCWELPAAGEVILVFDLLDAAMRTKPTGVRVVETTDDGDSESIVRTVAYREPKSYPTGTIDLHGTFETGKHYAALVSVGDEKPQVLKAPIQVLEPPGRPLAPIAATVVLVTVILGLLQRRRLSFGRRGSRRSRKG